MLSHRKLALYWSPSLIAVYAGRSGDDASSAAAVTPSVKNLNGGGSDRTAQKRKQNIQDVGMSVATRQATSSSAGGDGHRSVAESWCRASCATPNYGGVTLYTTGAWVSRTSPWPAARPLSLYLDEAPLPYSILSAGATLDLERVRGPQRAAGDAVRQQCDGGAINYIAAKPTRQFTGVCDFSYGRFRRCERPRVRERADHWTISSTPGRATHTSGPGSRATGR